MDPGDKLPDPLTARRTVMSPTLRRAPEQREMAVILGLAFFLNLFAGSLLQYAHFRWGLFMSQILFIAGPALLAIRWFYLDRASIMPLAPPSPAVLGSTVLGVVGLSHLLTLMMTWQELLFPQPRILRALLESLLAFSGPLDLVWVLLLAGGVVPLCEEILFRGFLQAGMIHLLESGPKGVVAGAVLFAVFHMDPWRFGATLLLGLYLGLLVHRTGSLIPAILAHSLNNVLAILVTQMASAGRSLDPSFGTVAAALALLGGSALLLPRRAPRALGGRML